MEWKPVHWKLKPIKFSSVREHHFQSQFCNWNCEKYIFIQITWIVQYIRYVHDARAVYMQYACIYVPVYRLHNVTGTRTHTRQNCQRLKLCKCKITKHFYADHFQKRFIAMSDTIEKLSIMNGSHTIPMNCVNFCIVWTLFSPQKLLHMALLGSLFRELCSYSNKCMRKLATAIPIHRIFPFWAY